MLRTFPSVFVTGGHQNLFVKEFIPFSLAIYPMGKQPLHAIAQRKLHPRGLRISLKTSEIYITHPT